MKKIRFIAAAAGLSIIFSEFGSVVNAADYTDGAIYRFDSFGNYTAERGKGLPDGWSLQSGAVISPEVGSVTDNERSGNVMKIEPNNSTPGLLFGSIFESGKMHISFDIKQTGDSNFADTTYIKSFRLDLNGDPYLNTENTQKDPTIDDPTVFSKGNGYGHNLFDTMNATSESEDKQFITAWEWAHRWSGTRRVSKNFFTHEKWHKLEFYIDKDSANQSVYIYMDGEEISFFDADNKKRTISLANSDLTAKLKGMFFTILKRQSQSGDTRGFLFDNVYVKSYNADEIYLDSPNIATDDGRENGVPLKSGVVNVGFSEYMNRPVTAEDVTVTSFQTGKKVTNYSIENADNMQFDIHFDDSELMAGRYIVTVNNVTGAVTGLGVKDTAVFGTEVSYIDGIAVPWVDDITVQTYNGKESGIDKDVSTLTDKIKVKFSAPVSASDLQSKLFILQNGEEFTYKDVTTEDNNCTAVLNLDGLLAPNAEYKIEVSPDICAEGSDSVHIMYGYDTGFKTADDGAVVATSKTYKTTGRGTGLKGILDLNVLKSTDKAEQLTLFVTAHTEVYDSVLEKNVKKTVVLGASALEYAQDERIIKGCSVSVPIYDLGDAELEYYLVGYPNPVSISRGTAQ